MRNIPAAYSAPKCMTWALKQEEDLTQRHPKLSSGLSTSAWAKGNALHTPQLGVLTAMHSLPVNPISRHITRNAV